MRNFIFSHAHAPCPMPMPASCHSPNGVVAAASCGLVIRSKGISFMTIATIFVALVTSDDSLAILFVYLEILLHFFKEVQRKYY